MSLKAKLEAVIYAAEEPITLAQLSVLFAGEALAWKAARDAERAPELPMTAPDEDSSQELIDTVREVTGEATGEATGLESEVTPADAETIIAELSGRPQAHESGHPVEPAQPVESDQPAAFPESPAANPEEAELEARRQERRREKEAREALREILNELIAEYGSDGRGLEIREIAGGFRMGTKPEMHDAVRAFVKSLKPALKLSLPALETLAVIAYKQPVTAPEVAEIRGVDSAGVLGSLMSRKLIATAGRKQVIGRPMLYKTTKEFLLRFGLKDVNELPSMEEFEKMAALELSEDAVDEGSAQTGDLFAESETATVPQGGPYEESDSEFEETAEADAAAHSAPEASEEPKTEEPKTEEPAQPQAGLEQNAEATEVQL